MTLPLTRFRVWLRWAAFILCFPACAAPQGAGAPSAIDAKDLPSHVIMEGGSEEPLWMDTGRVADFGQSSANGPVIRPVEDRDTSSSRAGVKAEADLSGAKAAPVSPLFLDAAGQPRALPGGVIVGLKEALSEPQARLQLEAAGLVPLRSLGARMWLVDSPAGMESMHLAERLNAEGRFDFVEPNWWRPRSTK